MCTCYNLSKIDKTLAMHRRYAKIAHLKAKYLETGKTKKKSQTLTLDNSIGS